MFKAFGAFFRMCITWISVADKLASAVDHVATLAEEEAQGLLDERRAERKLELDAKLNKLKAA